MAQRRARNLTLALMVLAVLLGVGFAFLSFPVVRPWVSGRQAKPARQEVGLRTVYEVLDLLQEEYIRALDTRELLEGALKGMEARLEEAGVADADLADLPPDRDDRPALLKAFEERFGAARKAGAEKKVAEPELTYAALRGLVEAVGDPYTTVMDPKQFHRLDEQMKGGNFGGVGIYIELDARHSNRLTVVEPIDGSPAADAGVLPGDWITEIDGESTADLDIEHAAARIRGPVGSAVTLTLKRAGRDPFRVKLLRQKIHVSSATSELLKDHIGYVRLRFFGDDTPTEFAEALKKVREAGARALVIDLRNNGGGYINAALDVVSNFVDKGEVVVSVVNPRTQRNEPHRATGADGVGLPMVVLVNEFSASASEITAGALHDLRVAHLVGKKSFGKASVQNIHPLPDGGALKYTVAHYLTPSGRDIHRNGIAPDTEVEAEPSNQLGGPDDRQLEAAVAWLKKQMAMTR